MIKCQHVCCWQCSNPEADELREQLAKEKSRADDAENATDIFATSENKCDDILRGIGLADTVNVVPRVHALAKMYQDAVNLAVKFRAEALEQAAKLKASRACADSLRELMPVIAVAAGTDYACAECLDESDESLISSGSEFRASRDSVIGGFRCRKHTAMANLLAVTTID